MKYNLKTFWEGIEPQSHLRYGCDKYNIKYLYTLQNELAQLSAILCHYIKLIP